MHFTVGLEEISVIVQLFPTSLGKPFFRKIKSFPVDRLPACLQNAVFAKASSIPAVDPAILNRSIFRIIGNGSIRKGAEASVLFSGFIVQQITSAVYLDLTSFFAVCVCIISVIVHRDPTSLHRTSFRIKIYSFAIYRPPARFLHTIPVKQVENMVDFLFSCHFLMRFWAKVISPPVNILPAGIFRLHLCSIRCNYSCSCCDQR